MMSEFSRWKEELYVSEIKEEVDVDILNQEINAACMLQEVPIRTTNYPVPFKRFKPDLSSDKQPSISSYKPSMSRFRSYTILGTEIHFPHKPYAVQMALMTRVIKALKSSEHALLESPTGTGKTLALLCSTLAWQKEKVKEIEENFLKEHKEKSLVPEAPVKSNDPFAIPTTVSDGDDDDDFVQLPQHMLDLLQTQTRANSLHMQDNLPEVISETHHPKSVNNKKQYSKKPKIYYGTRTHKQIAQVVKELRENTPYVPEIAILGSREQYCIHPTASVEKNKNEKCQKLCTATRQAGTDKLWGQVRSLRQYILEEGLNDHENDPEANLASIFVSKAKRESSKPPKTNKKHCIYSIDNKYLAKQMKSTTFLSNLRQDNENVNDTIGSPVWDIEDLKLAGKKVVGCPFFASRILAETAEIIFCPYNYVLHPSIRKSMNIVLEGNIFIFDEAHNIEDMARESASLDISESTLKSTIEEFNYFQGSDYEVDILKLLISVLVKFMDSDSGFIINEFEMDKEQRIFHPSFFWNFLADHQIGKDKLPQLVESLEILRKFKKTQDYKHGGDVSSSRFVISDVAEQTVDNILEVLLGIVNHETAYKIATVKTLHNQKEWSVSLGFWCQDSGTVFSFIADKARSVILASGTLSPMNTFSSELNSKFEHVLEGSHVVGSDQLWAGILPCGPSKTQFLGTYQNTQSHSYQDDMGDSILNIVEKVPNGILCFFPSYASMNRLMARWKSTNLWSQIEEIKPILIEPSNNRSEFEQVLSTYRSLSKDQGAILLGVFRGKFSEGIDFRDEECRCVISIGIPFPFLKDLKVELKKSFNGRYAQTRGMLNGKDWYVIQGYRAINQALGRCIRHYADWGSIVLLESRFIQPSHSDFLSRWILKSMLLFTNFNDAMVSLDQFMKSRLESVNPASNLPEPNVTITVSNRSESNFNSLDSDKIINSRVSSEVNPESIVKSPELVSTELEVAQLVSPNITISPIIPTNLDESDPFLMDNHSNHDSFDSKPLKSPVKLYLPSKDSSFIALNHFPVKKDFPLENHFPLENLHIPDSLTTSNASLNSLQESSVWLSNLSESSLNVPPWKRISCMDCQKFLFLASSQLIENEVVSQLKYPSTHFASYVAVKLQSLPKHSLSPKVSSTLSCYNSYTDMEDGISYGHLVCRACQSIHQDSVPKVITILLQSKRIQEDLCHWVWVHPSLQNQLGYLPN